MNNKYFAIISKDVYIPMYKGYDLETISNITKFSKSFILKLLESEEFKQQLKMFVDISSIYSIEEENDMVYEFKWFMASLVKYGVDFFHSDSNNTIDFTYIDKHWTVKNSENKIIFELIPSKNLHLNKKWFLDMVKSYIPTMVNFGFYYSTDLV